MIPIKKIFIDSKARAVGSTSTSNFIIDLPESYTMPEDCAFHIDDVCTPCSWYLVRDNFNDYCDHHKRRFAGCPMTKNCIMSGPSPRVNMTATGLPRSSTT